MKNLSRLLLVVLAGVGLVDAAYLSAQHYRGGSVVCEIGGHVIGDCSAVTSSVYATVGPIPVALIGVGYYFVLLVLSALLLSYDTSRLTRMFRVVVALGFLATLYFVFLQLFVLNAICVYCMVSAAATTLLFIFSWLRFHTKYLKSGTDFT